jgi:hypothetical protein
MQIYAGSDRLSVNNILFFIIVLFIAFLPLTSFLFFIKNDAFNGYFPPKFFMSESIHSGYLPLWNPYINFGFPQYADMSGGFWSPITWLIASTVGYNAYTFTIEIFLYILIGGIGMYKLAGLWNLTATGRMIAGLAFMCCGYTVGHLQHFNWLSGAAFLPLCFFYFQLLLHAPTPKRVIENILFFYLLIASAHPGITIGAAYFFPGLLLFHLFNKAGGPSLPEKIKKISLPLLVTAIGLIVLATGMILGYADVLPHFVRGEKPLLSSALPMERLHPKNWLSVLLPFGTVKNDGLFITDLSMRNCYFSLCLLLFFLSALCRPKNSWQKFLLLAGLFFALLSTGGMFRTFGYSFLPLTGFVRLSGEFRIFSILCFILVAVMELDKFIRGNHYRPGNIRWIFFFLQAILAALVVYGIYQARHHHESFLYKTGGLADVPGMADRLKYLVDSISFYDTLWIQGIVQLFLLWLLRSSIRHKKWGSLKWLVTADLVLASLLNIPFTGAGKASVAQLQHVLDRSPVGITIPPLQPISQNDSLPENEKYLLGSWSMYNKQIGFTQQVPYPIILNNMKAYFDSLENGAGGNYLNKPFLFLQPASPGDSIYIRSFSPTELYTRVTSADTGMMIIQQNFYPHWFYYRHQQRNPVHRAGINFMAVPVLKGDNDLLLRFEPTAIKKALLFSGLIFIFLSLVWAWLSFRSPSPSLHRQRPHP